MERSVCKVAITMVVAQALCVLSSVVGSDTKIYANTDTQIYNR